MERFKFVALRREHDAQFNESLFAPDRYFDVRATDTNINQAALLSQRDKYGRAEWIGDKVPGLYKRAHLVFGRFPNATAFCMLRDPLDVAASWQVRANNTNDRWPKTNDFLRGIDEWNKANMTLRALSRRFSDRLVFVRYENFFGGGESQVRQVLARLNLEPEASLMSFARKQFIRYEELRATRKQFVELHSIARTRIDSAVFDELNARSIV